MSIIKILDNAIVLIFTALIAMTLALPLWFIEWGIRWCTKVSANNPNALCWPAESDRPISDMWTVLIFLVLPSIIYFGAKILYDHLEKKQDINV